MEKWREQRACIVLHDGYAEQPPSNSWEGEPQWERTGRRRVAIYVYVTVGEQLHKNSGKQKNATFQTAFHDQSDGVCCHLQSSLRFQAQAFSEVS